MTERTLPTSAGGIYGMSPIDGYLSNDERPVAYFEHNLDETLNDYMTTVEVVTNCNIETLGMVQGLNVTVTLGSSSWRGSTACAIYAKVDLGAISCSISGRTSVIEARLDIPSTTITGTVTGRTSCLCLDFSNTLDTWPDVAGCSYILLRDRSSGARQMNTLLDFMDFTAVAASSTKIFVESTDTGSTHRIRMMSGTTPYWIMCTSTVPA